MGVQKNATYKVHNGTDFDEINFKTIAEQVKRSDGKSVQNFFDEGGIINGNIRVKKDDGYIEVEDSAGRRMAMHTNGGVGWIHLFDASGRVINDITLNPDGSISSKGTSLTKIPSCKVYHPTSQVFPGGSVKNTLAWDSILFSSNTGMCGNAGATANIVVPETGIYQFDATIVFSSVTGQVQATLSKNNSEAIDTKYLTATGGTNSIQLNGMYALNAGEYVQIHLYYAESGAITVLNSSRFQAYLVRGKI